MPDTDFEKLFARISDPAIVTDDAGGRVFACNDAFSKVLGCEAASLVGFELSTLVRVDSRDEEEERTVLLKDNEELCAVQVERLDCRWDGHEAKLMLVRPLAQGAEAMGVTSDEMSALFDYLREATEQLEVVNRIIAAVNAGRSIEQMFSLASEQVRALVPFDRASIAIRNEDGENLRVFAISGQHAGSLAVGATAQLSGSVTEQALDRREMIVIPELSAEKRFNIYADLEREGFHSAVCCPLFSTRQAIGSLNLTSRTPDAYQRKHLLALERLGPPLAIAIEKVLLLEQSERRSREMESAARREELAGRIGRQLSSSLDPSAVLQETVDALGQALSADRCHISLFDGGEDYALVSYEYLARREVASLRGHRIPLRSSRFTQEALAADAPVAASDIRALEQSELTELYERLQVRAVLAAPVIVGGAHEGLLELHDGNGARAWTEDERRLVGAVAAQVSVALTNARLYEATRHRREELQGLYNISRAFSTLNDTSDIYGKLTKSIAGLVGGEKCLLATYDRRARAVRAEAPGYNTPPDMITGFQFSLNQNNGGGAYLYRTGEQEYQYQIGDPFFSNSPADDERFNQEFLAQHGVRSVLIVPMLIKRELIGFIYVANRPGGFRQRDVRLLEIFAAQAAETIANARLFATIQAQAEREAIVNRLLLTLQQASDPQRGVEIIVERVGEVLGLDRCVVMLQGENETPSYYSEWCAENVLRLSNDAEVRERSPVGHWIQVHRQPLVVADASSHSLAAGVEDIIERINLKSLAVVPIIHHGRVIGTLSGHQTRAHRRWAEDDVDLLTAVAMQIGGTLENARLIAELREASRLKDEFLATISHELRTPLTAIRGWVDLLSENPALEDDQELQDGINVIQNSAVSLSQLISDLLDLSRIQRKVLRLDCKPLAINEPVLDAVQSVRQAAVARNLELKLELGENLPVINADAHRLQQVLWNLLHNAIKFTPEGGQISIRSRLLDTTEYLIGDDEESDRNISRWIVLEVSDTGEGIPPDFLPYVWDRFRQADGSSTRRHGGLGIGLALVKELVEAHGGQVEAKSEGRGAIFIVRLPVTSESGSGLRADEGLRTQTP
ncbi:MAG: GAF domain-containing protein [Pyrinomonadaceae bacterium]|nr:GAF domain-containing protein [Pyrinomonadaceae bacterium]